MVISTFTDEKLLSFSDDTTYLQFWTFKPNSASPEATLKFLLEIPDVFGCFELSLVSFVNRKNIRTFFIQKMWIKATRMIFWVIWLWEQISERFLFIAFQKILIKC